MLSVNEFASELKLARLPACSLLPSSLYLLCLALRSLGEGGSLIPFAPFFLLPFAFFLSVLANAISLKDYSSFFRSKETPA